MKVKTKFELGEKFKINKDYRKVMNVTEKDIFRIHAIEVNKYGIYYSYYKFPADKNRTWNKKFGYRSHVAEFVMEKLK